MWEKCMGKMDFGKCWEKVQRKVNFEQIVNEHT